jgi:alkylation response protein AidB-like acyl-CoA dehydrogenase
MKTFEVERLLLGAMAVGTAQRALDEAVIYAGQRHQFGQAIGNFQAVAHLLADMATSVAASRAFVFSVADRLAAGKPCAQEAAMVKLFTTEQTKQVCLSGMQVLGGYGYLAEFDMERLLRDSLLGPVGGGTSQIQRSIIAKGLGFRA